MRCIRVLALVVATLVTACGPSQQNPENTSLLGTTGYSNPRGFDYVSNGDRRVEEALREPEPDTPRATPKNPQVVTPPKRQQPPTTPAPATPAPNIQKPLRERLKEFEISRFYKDDKMPYLFGDHEVELRFIFRGQPTAEFKNVKLKGAKPKFLVEAESGNYEITGELKDTETQTLGEFFLTEKSTGDRARIFYWAYKARVRLREDRTQKITDGSYFDKQRKMFNTDTYGWVHNWSVVRGPSFFITDIIKPVAGSKPEGDTSGLSFSLKGESLRTGSEVHPTDVVGQGPGEVNLVGNAEEGTGRMFSITMEDPESKEKREFMLDIELDGEMTPVDRPGQQGQTPPALPSPPAQPETPEPFDESPPLPRPRPPEAGGQQQEPAEQPEETVRVGKSYLRADLSMPRSRKMTEDFNRNRNLTGVKTWMNTYKGNWKSSLVNFYTYANPFREILEIIGKTFDVSPAYAYVTVVESPYFTGGKYKIIRPIKNGKRMSSALGPFQLLLDTAKSNGLYVGNGEGDDDERRFFVPSACGAARYFRTLVNIFNDSDTTVSILGYYQGQGGAAAAIYCSYATNAGDREACAKRINKSFNGADYNRFLKLVKSFNYNFAEMDRMAAIPGHMREYVHKKLAVYFISNDYANNGFDIRNAPTKGPTNGTIIPEDMRDKECQRATADAVRKIKPK